MIKKIIGILFCTLIASCATVSTVTSKSTLDPNDGLVIFKLSSDAQAIGFFRYWQGVKVRVLNEKYTKEFVIGYSSKGNMRSAVYFGSLPKGIISLLSFHLSSAVQCVFHQVLASQKKWDIFPLKVAR